MRSGPPAEAVVVGTRRSALAQRQTARVVELLEAAWPGLSCEVRPIVTQGDRTQASEQPLREIGGKGLFTAELEQGLRDGGLDLAVHSLKDLPTEDPLDVTIGAVCPRDDARDCLVSRDGSTLAGLADGAVVGTSSLRRSAQLHAFRPGLDVRSIRGNVDTRIRKVHEGAFDGTVLAAAGILRLGLEDEVSEWLPVEAMLPAPGQGALGGGCAAPVAAHAGQVGTEAVHLVGLVLSPDGREIVRVEGEGAAEDVGERLAREALAAGADRILAAVRG